MYYRSPLRENDIFITCYICDWCTCHHSDKNVDNFYTLSDFLATLFNALLQLFS